MLFRLMFLLFFALVLFGADDEFEKYKNGINKEYSEYYEKEMKAFETFSKTAGGIPDKVNPYQNMKVLPPKPVVAKPSTPPKIETPKPEPVTVKPINKIPEGTPSDSQLKTVKLDKIDPSKLIKPEPVPVTKEPSVVTPEKFQLAFFGTNIDLTPENIKFTKTINGNNTSEIAMKIKQNDARLIKEMSSIRQNYNLNDWDSFIFVQTLVNTLYTENQKKIKTLHAIDIMRGLGYRARFAEDDSGAPYILLETKQQLFSKAYIDKDGGRFYIFAIDAHPRASFAKALYFSNSPDDSVGQPIDMIMHNDPKLGTSKKPVKLSWDFDDKPYQMTVNPNENLTSLMDMYPVTDYAVYMQSRSGKALAGEIAANLFSTIKQNNYSKEKSVAFILKFTQKAFVYKTTFEAYGYERPLFLEQAILLPYTDCKHRAMMLSNYYREILGLDSIGLLYPGHISLGVSYNGSGDFYMLDGKKYFVTDGTYFYALPGTSQPSFKGMGAKFVPTK